MDLLESTLRVSGAEKYIQTFRENGVDAGTLPLIKESDLKLLGVEEELIKNILKNVGNLQIPSEKKVDLAVNKEYTMLVLNSIAQQLHRHYGNLSSALIRNDVIVCDVNVAPAAECLVKCLYSLEDRINDFEKQILPKRRSSRKKQAVILALGLLPVAVFVVNRILR